MLKNLMKGKSKKTHDSSSRSENVPHKKRAHRESSRHGEGGSSVQAQQPPSSPPHQPTGEQVAQQERRQHLGEYARAYVDKYNLSPNAFPYHNKFLRKEFYDRHLQIKNFNVIKEKGFSQKLVKVPEIFIQLERRGWLQFNALMNKENLICDLTLVREFFANAYFPSSDRIHEQVYVRGVLVDYSADALNKFLEVVVPSEDDLIPFRERLKNESRVERAKVKDFVGRPGIVWKKDTGSHKPTKLDLGHLTPVARVWTKFLVRSVEPRSNQSDYQIGHAAFVMAIMTGMDINLGYWLNNSISHIAGHTKPNFSLGHCNLITALCRSQGVPNVEGESPWVPYYPISLSYFEGLDDGPIVAPVNAGEHHVPLAHHGAVDIEGDVAMNEEYHQFEQGDHLQQPPHHEQQQQQQQEFHPHPGAPNIHSKNEIAALLHTLDLNEVYNLPNLYYNTSGSLYTEAMNVRQNFPPISYFPRYPTREAWNAHKARERSAFNAREMIMDSAWEEQFGDFERAQAAANDIGINSTTFTMEDLGFREDDRFLHNFMNSNDSADS
ncbi:hypothetical protein A2U01_0000761 [Trifolium medium]|uniref:Putative plant transposon protein domain-containing protein n=1 Tax=Trifolium medium TaxID=97028 RepID=A0A392LYH1_9FABA|nr:hypothetical protein [Trifolium medium]